MNYTRTMNNIEIQTPWQEYKWVEKLNDDTGITRYYLKTIFRTEEAIDGEEKKFLDFLDRFDNKIVDYAYNNQLKWFKTKNDSVEDIQDQYISSVYRMKDDEGVVDKTKNPSFRCKIPFYRSKDADNDEGSFKIEAYDHNEEKIDSESIAEEFAAGPRMCRLVIKLNPAYFNGSGFGVPMSVVKLQLDQSDFDLDDDACFESSSDSETESDEE